MTKDKRGDIRIPLLSESALVQEYGFLWNRDPYSQELDMDNVGNEGAFFKVKPGQPYPPGGTMVTVKFKLPGDLGILQFEGKVCRMVWRLNKKKNLNTLGFAVNFMPKTESVQKIWDAYRVYLRNKQIITVSKRIIEEFFGGPKTPGF